jgi:hypothetical protein
MSHTQETAQAGAPGDARLIEERHTSGPHGRSVPVVVVMRSGQGPRHSALFGSQNN